MSGAPQQVNISDLDLSSLAEVKRQLEEVLLPPKDLRRRILQCEGTFPLDELPCATQASAVEVQVVHRECRGAEATESECVV